ncbi:MAG: DUF4169 family protein [Emcibacter sp.]|nr:DUF4169 family protein [Emcibacter sp.]
MGTVINFRQAEKKITRRKKDKLASENRIIFGRKKSEKTLSKKEKAALNTHLDEHKTDAPETDAPKEE